MKRLGVIAFVIVAAACAHTPAPKTFAELRASNSWHSAEGAKLENQYDAFIAAIVQGKSTSALVAGLEAEDYVCTATPQHDTTVCAAGFATRACQMDWTVTLTHSVDVADKIESAVSDFGRDCVGRSDDWPEPVDSAIDDMLAKPPPLN